MNLCSHTRVIASFEMQVDQHLSGLVFGFVASKQFSRKRLSKLAAGRSKRWPRRDVCRSCSMRVNNQCRFWFAVDFAASTCASRKRINVTVVWNHWRSATVDDSLCLFMAPTWTAYSGESYITLSRNLFAHAIESGAVTSGFRCVERRNKTYLPEVHETRIWFDNALIFCSLRAYA
jgi:hypothetical protein